MTALDPLYAQWLMAESDWITREHAGARDRWGASGRKSERLTGIARRIDAEAEADRQLAFFARGPFAVDVHQLMGGDWDQRRGQVVRITNDQLGYPAGVDVFVLEAEVDRATGISAVTVLCPLEGTA